MKKILALVAVAVASVALAAADPILFAHGFAGWNAGATIHDYDSNTKPFGDNLDFGGGIALNIPFGGYFGVQPGVDFYFNRFGYKSSETSLIGGGTNKVNVRAHYMSVDIPVLLTVKYKKFNFALGPNFSIPFNFKAESTSVTEGAMVGNGTVTSDATPSGEINHFIVGMQFGAGYEERLGMARLIGAVRYLLDFMPLTNTWTDSSDKKHIDKIFTRRALFIDIGAKIPLSF